ncbi:hypothetical protein BHM03_00019880 [Ensete ventricosum]|nr:hypothetical protein BHM03_00019880 [Ensete ventricosum]
MLVKYREELSRPLQEAMEFLGRMESQLNSISDNSGSLRIISSGDVKELVLGFQSAVDFNTAMPRCATAVCQEAKYVRVAFLHVSFYREVSCYAYNYIWMVTFLLVWMLDEKFGGCSVEENQEVSGGEMDIMEIDPCTEDQELKHHLLKKYGGYLSSLKQELSKKKKKGKLPKDARQQLLNWWELHYKWPYPSEAQKAALAESTGLDMKQINNWFINQRKRHWKPSEDMQFVMMDGYHAPNAAALYMDGNFMSDGLYRFGP